MTGDPFGDLIRTALTDLAAEARPVALAQPALRQAQRRRRIAGAAGVAGVAAALAASPLAVALVPTGSPPPGPGHGCPNPSAPTSTAPNPTVPVLAAPSASGVSPSYWHGPAVEPVAPGQSPIPHSPGAAVPRSASPYPSPSCPR